MDSTSAETTSSIRMPVFDGKHENFLIWWTRFEAYAEVKKFARSLQEGGEDDLPQRSDVELDVNVDAKKAQYLALKRNSVAVANLAMAFTTQGLINMIASAKDNDFPGGRAHS